MSREAHALEEALPSAELPANTLRMMLGLGVVGGEQPGAELSFNWEHPLEHWLAIGATAGVTSSSGERVTSYATFVGPLVKVHTAPEGIQWFLAASVGGGVSSYAQTSCSDTVTWNEGSCDTDEHQGAGLHGGVQLGGTGRTLGVVARAEFTAPSFASVTLNLSLAW